MSVTIKCDGCGEDIDAGCSVFCDNCCDDAEDRGKNITSGITEVKSIANGLVAELAELRSVAGGVLVNCEKLASKIEELFE